MIVTPLVARPTRFCFYAVHGGGKSLLSRQAATWLHRTQGLKTRVVSLDPGSYGQYEQGIRDGYIEYLSVDGWDSLAPDFFLEKLASGWWPEDSNIPNSRIVPGFEEIRVCPHCNADSGSRGPVHLPACKACKKPFAGRVIPITRHLTGLAGIGLYVFEGLTRFSQTFLESNRLSRPGDKFFAGNDHDLARAANDALKRREAKERTQEETQALQAAYEALKEGRLSLQSGAEKGHYYKAGASLQALLGHSNRIPIPYVIFTAHEGRWEEKVNPKDDDSPKKLLGLGPSLIPAKAMKNALQDFVVVGRIVVERDGRRTLWLDKHPGEGAIMWEAKRNIAGLPEKLALPDFAEANGFELLMGEIEKCKGRNLP